jgi:valyl-tRNA synthetase
MALDMDIDAEASRLEKEIRKVGKDLDIADRKLSNKAFISKAPPEVVEKVKAKREALLVRDGKLRESLGKIQEIQDSNVSNGRR